MNAGPNYIPVPTSEVDLLRRFYADGSARCGRGKLTGFTRKAKNLGWISVQMTGTYTWASFITAKGRAVIARDVLKP